MVNPQTFQNNIETLDYPVSKLFNRYRRVRSVIYSRMSDLSIETFKKDGRSYIKHTHLKLLDELDNYLAKGAGRTIKKFIKLKNPHQPPNVRYTPPDVPDTVPDALYTLPDASDTVPDVAYILPDVSNTVPDVRYTLTNLAPPHNKMNEPCYYTSKINQIRAFYELLDDAVDKKWDLTNEYLAELLQINIQYIKDSNTLFFAGYDFKKTRVNFGEEAKEEWWTVSYFDKEQAERVGSVEEYK